MTSEPNDFARLRKVLSCKRYEQPPPGYFNRFSDRVLARIEGDDFSQPPSWWSWVLEKIETKPILTGAYSVVAFGLLLLTGFKLSEVSDDGVSTIRTLGGNWQTTAPSEPAFATSGEGASLLGQIVPAHASSLTPAFRPESPGPLLMGSVRVQTATFSPSY